MKFFKMLYEISGSIELHGRVDIPMDYFTEIKNMTNNNIKKCSCNLKKSYSVVISIKITRTHLNFNSIKHANTHPNLISLKTTNSYSIIIIIIRRLKSYMRGHNPILT